MDLDFYKSLGVSKNATADEIKKQYRKLSKQYHPDLQQGKSDDEKKAAEEKFKEISEAYDTLSDPEKRKQYDAFGGDYRRKTGGTPFDMGSFFRQNESMFSDFFGGFGGGFGSHFNFGWSNGPSNRGRSADNEVNGRDIQAKIRLSFKDSLFGCTKEFDIKSTEECPDCHGNGGKNGSHPVKCHVCNGSGMKVRNIQNGFSIMQFAEQCESCGGSGEIFEEVCPRCNGEMRVSKKEHFKINIPQGIRNGAKIAVRGRGECGIRGGKNGDFYGIVEVEPSRIFERNGDKLKVKCYVNPLIAICGGEAEVPTPHGIKKIAIKPGTKNYSTLSLKNEGVNGGSLDVVLEYDNLLDVSDHALKELSRILSENSFSLEKQAIQRNEYNDDF